MKQQDSIRDRNAGDRTNKSSSLLSQDENEQVFSLLGRKCQSMCTTVGQVYQTEGAAHSIWKKKHTGVLCFVRDSSKRSYFMRMYCLLKNDVVWEHEIYDQINIIKSRPYLLTFEGQNGHVGLNFASETECDCYYQIVVTMDERSRKRQERRTRSRGQTVTDRNVPNNAQSVGTEEPGKVTLRNHPQLSTVSLTANTNTPSLKPIVNFDKKSKKRGRKFSKSDISNPMNFVHVSHVGWNAQKGFDMVGSEDDEMLKHFFTKAGVSEQELKDRATRDFIYDFVKNHDVLASVKSERVEKSRAPAPPPVPTRHPAAQNGTQRSAPPPPPARQPPPPLPTTTPPSRAPPPTRPPPITSNVAAVPSPPPPPPPPLPQLTVAPPPPAMPQKITADNSPSASSYLGAANDNRNALMDSIRKGTTLKKVDQSTLSTGSGDSRSDLMSEIRQGIELRPVENRELAPSSNRSSENTGTDALADALRRALQDRGRAIHSSDDDSDESSENDGEWED